MRFLVPLIVSLMAGCPSSPVVEPPAPLQAPWTALQGAVQDGRVVTADGDKLVVAFAKPDDDHSTVRAMAFGAALEGAGMSAFAGRRPFPDDNSVGWVHEVYDAKSRELYVVTKQNVEGDEQITVKRSAMPLVLVSRYRDGDSDVKVAATCLTDDMAKLHAGLQEALKPLVQADKKTQIFCYPPTAGAVRSTWLDQGVRHTELYAIYGQAFKGAAHRLCFGGVHAASGKFKKCVFDDAVRTESFYDASVKEP